MASRIRFGLGSTLIGIGMVGEVATVLIGGHQPNIPNQAALDICFDRGVVGGNTSSGSAEFFKTVDNAIAEGTVKGLKINEDTVFTSDKIGPDGKAYTFTFGEYLKCKKLYDQWEPGASKNDDLAMLLMLTSGVVIGGGLYICLDARERIADATPQQALNPLTV